MNWQTLLTTILGSGASITAAIIVCVKWAERRATTYLDTSVTEEIKRYHAAKLEELKEQLAGNLELAKGNISVEVELRKFQLPLYSNLWAVLADVKVTGDILWRACTFDNLTAFRDRLAIAERLVHATGGLLPIEEYQQLAHLIESFQEFKIGKEELLRTYENRAELYAEWMDSINITIQNNRGLWTRYNELFQKMQATSREHFHRPLTDAALGSLRASN